MGEGIGMSSGSSAKLTDKGQHAAIQVVFLSNTPTDRQKATDTTETIPAPRLNTQHSFIVLFDFVSLFNMHMFTVLDVTGR